MTNNHVDALAQKFDLLDCIKFDGLPPIYESETALHPVTSISNRRYTRITTPISPQYTDVPTGIHSVMSLPTLAYLPPGWTLHVNPEGSPYYVNDAESICIVTDAPLHRQELHTRLSLAIDLIQHTIKSIGYAIPINSELYVHIDDASETCDYYFVDHDSRVEFWLQDCDSCSLGLPEVASQAHLKHVLEEHYWTHVEYFPHCHLDARPRDALINILGQARGDLLTSNSSTFPYNADQCAKFIELLNVEYVESPYMTWIVARIWTAIARHRFQNYYGENFARLDRGHRLLEAPLVHCSWVMRICSLLLLGTPRTVEAELQRLFVDRMVFANHWNEFARALQRSWRETSLLSLGLVITNAGFLSFSMNTAFKSLRFFSASLSLGSLLSSVVLLQWYCSVSKPNATVVASHMGSIEHPSLGFGPIAAVYSLPRALLFWALFFLAIHMLLLAADGSSLAVKYLVAVVAGLVVVSAWKIATMLGNWPSVSDDAAIIV